jgi:hypothetical protein
MASRVSRLNENPKASISAAVPTSESGMVSTGISTARKVPRNRKITITTIRMASTSVLVTSSIDALTKCAESNWLTTSTPGGATRSMVGKRALTPLTISSGLPSGVGEIARKTARLPSCVALVS